MEASRGALYISQGDFRGPLIISSSWSVSWESSEQLQYRNTWRITWENLDAALTFHNNCPYCRFSSQRERWSNLHSERSAHCRWGMHCRARRASRELPRGFVMERWSFWLYVSGSGTVKCPGGLLTIGSIKASLGDSCHGYESTFVPDKCVRTCLCFWNSQTHIHVLHQVLLWLGTWAVIHTCFSGVTVSLYCSLPVSLGFHFHHNV